MFSRSQFGRGFFFRHVLAWGDSVTGPSCVHSTPSARLHAHVFKSAVSLRRSTRTCMARMQGLHTPSCWRGEREHENSRPHRARSLEIISTFMRLLVRSLLVSCSCGFCLHQSASSCFLLFHHLLLCPLLFLLRPACPRSSPNDSASFNSPLSSRRSNERKRCASICEH